jgi:hypothetical protein
MRNALILGLLSLSAFVGAPAASAQETGLDALHEQRREGNRICMVSHYHNGSSSSNMDSRKAAEASAIKDWVGFTTWEYGTPWGSYKLAASKKMDCSKSTTSTWSCKVEARACKPVPRRR